MSYITRDNLEAYIEADTLARLLLDDAADQDETEVLNAVCLAASNTIDRYLGAVTAVPLADPPAWLKDAAAIIACKILYSRRGIPAEQNPYADAAKGIEARLGRIASRKEELIYDSDAVSTAVTVPSKTYIENGAMI
jgi:phage gp36-like protein